MDIAKLILTDPVPQPTLLGDLDKIKSFSDERKKQLAKDFESVFISKLLDEMKNTVVDWGFEKDGVSEQIDGLFFLYLARDIANNGGFGLWKEIYKTMNNLEQQKPSTESLDKNI